MLVADRQRDGKYSAEVRYYVTKVSSDAIASALGVDSPVDLCIPFREDTEMVDGIGGTTWDGCIVVSRILERIFWSEIATSSSGRQNVDKGPLKIVELGCGTGLCSILGSMFCWKSTVTDRYVDLVRLNIDRLASSNENRFCADRRVDLALSNQVKERASTGSLSWECFEHEIHDQEYCGELSIQSIIAKDGCPDLIIGAEVTCLKKQQRILAGTIAALCDSNQEAVVLLSFDGPPPPSLSASVGYESSMLQCMKQHKFQAAVVFTAKIVWVKDDPLGSKNSPKHPGAGNNNVQKAYILDATKLYHNDLDSVAFPYAFLEPSTFAPLATGSSQPMQPSAPAKASSFDSKVSAASSKTEAWKQESKEGIDTYVAAAGRTVGEADEKPPSQYSLRPPAPPPPQSSDSVKASASSSAKDALFSQEVSPLNSHNVYSCTADAKGYLSTFSSTASTILGVTARTPVSEPLKDDIIEESMHHVIAFFRPAAVRTCQRCHKQFFCNTSLNPFNSSARNISEASNSASSTEKCMSGRASAVREYLQESLYIEGLGSRVTTGANMGCRYHPGLYVCRKHPGETRSSVAGHGDALGYYGDGSEHWAAEFWDCCGSEDPKAPGCKVEAHLPYD